MWNLKYLSALLIFLSLFVSNCDRDELEHENRICPELISPSYGDTLDNGCYDHSDQIIWSFDWEDCENASYNIVVLGGSASSPAVDEWVDTSEYIKNTTAYIVDRNRLDWTWKVRSLVDGELGDWSEVRVFDVEPLDTDCR